jgi:hypothetical protein
VVHLLQGQSAAHTTKLDRPAHLRGRVGSVYRHLDAAQLVKHASGCGRWRAATKEGGILGSSTSMPNLRRGPTGGLSILRQRDSMLRR